MALTKAQVREILSEAGISSENMKDAVDKIISGHLASIDVLREEADSYKADAEKLPDVQRQLDELKAHGDGGLSDLQTRYAALEKENKKLQKEFDTYKSDVTAKETRAAKEAAYRAILKEMKVDRADTVVRAAHADGVIDALELDENGAVKDADKLKDAVKANWSDFISYETVTGADIAHPPAGSIGTTRMTKEEISKIPNPMDQIRAMAQNLDQYGVPRKES